MLIRAFSKLIIFIGPLLILGYMFFVYFDGEATVENWSKAFDSHDDNASSRTQEPEPVVDDPLPTTLDGDGPDTVSADPVVEEVPSPSLQEPLPPPTFPVDEAGEAIVDYSVHREVFSASTSDRKYFTIDFGPGYPALNPNIIPHPHEQDKWIIVAQRQTAGDAIFEELVCNAAFQSDGTLACATPPTVLPVAPTTSDQCTGELDHFSLSVGPHDMRVFYGPDAPFSIFGSQSAHTCFGQIAQDFRTMLDDYALEALTVNLFPSGVELQRPQPWHPIEKNWFMFWDTQGNAYVHHDVEPKRVFAQLSADGSVGPDLAPLAASNDDACMAAYMPKPAREHENLHQATNSLAITLCSRNDPSCQPTDENTFIMTIFQHKKWMAYHALYEPYIMLFQQTAPFAVHAISRKPIWIHGRGPLSKHSDAARWKDKGVEPPKDHSEMFYVTSMSWKAHGQKYHGYVDDVLFVSFGIEDESTAAIDVLAGDLLQDLGLCKDVGV